MDSPVVIPGCAHRTRVYPSSAISLSKSATADLDGAGPESILPIVVDGVDGPLRHRLCQNNEVVEISDKGAVREPDYPHWNGYVEAFFSAARGGCRRAAGVAQEAAAQPGVGVFCQAAANRDRAGGLRGGPLLGAGVAQARPRGEADGAATREGLRQAQKERRARCRGIVRGDEPADDAVRAGE